MRQNSENDRADQLAAMLKERSTVKFKLTPQTQPSPERHKAKLKHPRNFIGLIGLVIGFVIAIRDVIYEGGFDGITFNGIFSGASFSDGFNSVILLELYSLVFLGLIYGAVMSIVLYSITNMALYLRRKVQMFRRGN